MNSLNAVCSFVSGFFFSVLLSSLGTARGRDGGRRKGLAVKGVGHDACCHREFHWAVLMTRTTFPDQGVLTMKKNGRSNPSSEKSSTTYLLLLAKATYLTCFGDSASRPRTTSFQRAWWDTLGSAAFGLRSLQVRLAACI